MGRLLIVLVVLGVVVAGVGFYRGWFQLTSNSAGGTSDVTLTLDKDKIREDGKNAQEKAETLGRPSSDKAAAPAK